MTSKERVLKTLHHTEPDRVPIDISGTLVTGIHWKAYESLRDFLCLEKRKTDIWDRIQGLARCEEDFLERLRVDTRGVLFRGDTTGAELLESTAEYEEFTDLWGITWRRNKPDGLYFDIVKSPLAAMELSEIKKIRWPDPKDKQRLDGLKEHAQEYSKSDRLVMLGATGWTSGLLQQFQWLLGYDKAFYSLAGEPELSDYLIGILAEQDMIFWDWAIPFLGTDIQIIVYADDYGMQNGPAMSHSMFEHYFKPRYRRIFEIIKKRNPDLKIFFHSCGSSRSVIPDLIEVGVDILNPVQVSAKDMDTRELKQDFGRDIVFWGGGIDTQRILPNGTKEEVENEVKRRIDDLAPGGGFVFTTVHNIQADVPPENIMTMWETVMEYAKY